MHSWRERGRREGGRERERERLTVKMNSERHYLVVTFVAKCSDCHYILQQMSLPGSDIHFHFFTELARRVGEREREKTRKRSQLIQCHILSLENCSV